MMQPTSSSVVFDLDGVLLSRDSTTTYLVSRLRSRPWLLVLALAPLLLFAISGPAPRARSLSSRAIIRVALLGRDHRAVSADLQRLAMTMAADHAIADAVARVRWHVDQGDPVLVNTASPHEFARPFLDALGLGDVDCVASRLTDRLGGTGTGRHNYHGHKVEQAAAAGWGEAYAVAYSDSWADEPLLRRARRPVLVNASARTRARAADLPDVEHVVWS